MKKKLIAIAAAMFVAITGAGSAVAQDGVVFIPVDIFACNYKDGQGPDDLDAATKKWNEYMDDNEANDYAAWTMTKHYASADQEFDVAWLGAHKNGTTMGAGADDYLANGGKIEEEFTEVLDCPMAGNYASRMFKAPGDGNVPGNGVLVFTNCSLEEGARYEDVVAATNEWVAILEEAGSPAAMYHWYPVFGTGEDDVGWKTITAYPNHAEFGKNYDRMGNGGLYMKSQELFGDLVDCDIARVYNAELRRSAPIRE